MLTFYHAPWSRSFSIFWLLEELGVDYEMELIDIRGGAPDAYRTIQPSKKVPAIAHDGTIVTERAAIALYLGEVFSEKGLAPVAGDTDRAAYLRMLVYHDAVFDPVICAKAAKLSYTSNDYPFGTFDDMLAHLEEVLATRPFITGERFTLADVIWGTGINYTMNVLKELPARPAFNDYLQRVTDRPAFHRTNERDAELASKQPALQEQFRSS